jgi:hypothetical protein
LRGFAIEDEEGVEDLVGREMDPREMPFHPAGRRCDLEER